jgi:hypothetical protein
MARSTFEGPILSGDNRFGPLRNVGYTSLVQDCSLVLTNTSNGTAGYAGGSGQFVNGNGIPNVNATVYTPSSSVFPPAAATITADSVSTTTGTLYRGCVFYLPYGSTINDILIDTNVLIALDSGSTTVSTVTAKIGNAFNTTTYGNITSVNGSAARNTVAQTGAQLLACNSTTGDITNPPSQYGGGGGTSPYSSLLSQVVVTFTIPYTGGTSGVLAVLTGGTLNVAIRYTQLDANIGNTTTYPYGNFD